VRQLEEKVLEMRNISKSFPGVRAVDEVTLELKKGEVLALVGENGAGKSTLMKILSGAYTADKGEIYINGEKKKITSPKDALDVGISVMYQEFNNFEPISIAENIFAGRLFTKGLTKAIDYRKLAEESRKILEEIGLKRNPFEKIRNLSVAEKQIVEIAKALSRDTKILVMDEPTAALNDKEVESLFRLIREIKEKGTSIIYISHRLDEIFQICDRVQVMRDGKSVYISDIKDTSKSKIISQMVGREMTDMYPKRESDKGGYVLEVEKLCTSEVSDISFKVRSGEVLCLFGLMGAGQANIVETLFGIRHMHSGKVKIDGKEVAIKNPRGAKKQGIAYVPSDRKIEGLMLRHSVLSNITLTILEKISNFLRIDIKKENKEVEKWVSRLNIKTPSYKTLVEKLSGGNQQKVVIAKWIAANPKVLILNEPTRGVDVGAKAEIYGIMEDLCENNVAIIMVSSDLNEVLSMSDRIVIIHEGRINGEVEGKEITQEKIMQKAVGE